MIDFSFNNFICHLIVYDFDGVMTDNKVFLDSKGHEFVTVNRSDGLAVRLLREKKIDQLIISTEKSNIIKQRALKLKIPFLCGIKHKKKALIDYCNTSGHMLDKIIYVGNDINDLDAMMSVGVPICPSDAYDEIKKISKFILSTKGGFGAVRELFNLIKIN